MFLFAIFLLAIIFYIKYRMNRSRLYEFGKSLPGPKTLPIIGNALMLAVPTSDLLHTFQNINSSYESPTRFWIGPELCVIIDKPEDIAVIMTSPLAVDKGPSYLMIADCIGFGLIQSNGLRHKIHRKLMTLPLRNEILDKHIQIFDIKGKECAELLIEKVDKDDFDVITYIGKSATALVSELILGINLHSNDTRTHKLRATFSELYSSVAERLYKYWLHPYIIYRFSKHYKIQKEGVKYFNSFINTIIKEKQEKFSKLENNHNVNNFQNISLEWLMQVKDNEDKNIFNIQEIREEMATLYTASEDTTATIVSFTLLMLGINKDIQQKVYEEQINIFGSNESDIKLESHHLKGMTYLTKVIQEVLRLFPVAPLMTRKIKGDLQMGNVLIPKGTTVIINMYKAHRNEKYWKNPTYFNPLRFTTEEIVQRSQYTYIPFSAGMRGCIGKEFAYMAMKSFISNIIRNYIIDTKWKMNDIKLKADISTRSINGYMISIKKRHKK